MQPQGHVEVLVNLLDFGMDVYAAGAAPRIEHLGSATPTGRPAAGSGTVHAEATLPASIVEELERRGHQVIVDKKKNGGGYEGILIDPKTKPAPRRIRAAPRWHRRRILKTSINRPGSVMLRYS